MYDLINPVNPQLIPHSTPEHEAFFLDLWDKAVQLVKLMVPFFIESVSSVGSRFDSCNSDFWWIHDWISKVKMILTWNLLCPICWTLFFSPEMFSGSNCLLFEIQRFVSELTLHHGAEFYLPLQPGTLFPPMQPAVDRELVPDFFSNQSNLQKELVSFTLVYDIYNRGGCLIIFTLHGSNDSHLSIESCKWWLE